MGSYDKYLPLEGAYRWEKEAPNRIYMNQPFPGGDVTQYSWEETMNQARRMATHLGSLGFEKGDRIAILSKNCAHFIITDLAIWMAGFVSVALYPTLNAETVEYILDHSESKFLFVGKLDVWDDMKAGVPDDMPCIAFPLAPETDYDKWDDIIAKSEPLEGNPKRDADEMALICYTSGSTGRPKGVMTSFNNMACAAKGINEVVALGPSDRQLSYLPLAHSFERAAVENSSLASGAQLFFAESLATFGRDLKRARPTLFHSVPRLWLKFQLGVFAKMPPKKLKRMLMIPILKGIVRKKVLTALGLEEARYAISGSAPIPGELIQWYNDLGLELLEGYAMTENFAYSHVSYPGKARVGYVGNPFPGVECKISDAGEILVKSDANMMGYYKMPEATEETFTEDGFLKTGDRGEIDSNGRLKITGRVKELFKTSKGKYIAPAPIENLINIDPHVEQSCVSGSGYPAAYAVVMLSEEMQEKRDSMKGEITAALEKLLASVNSKVEHHEHLQFFAVAKDSWQIENGFLTPTMKIKRSVLEDTYNPKLDGWYDSKQKVVWEA